MPKYLASLALASLICLAGLVISAESHVQTDIRSGIKPCRGVNLGGWLVTEHWMTRSSGIYQGVPDDIAINGEFAIMKHLGHQNGDSRFEQHRQTWITENDIKEIASFGLNTVRVPVGYWIAGFDKTGGTQWQTYAPGGLKYLDKLIKEWALKYNVAVLISIHAAKGSQNGIDHSAPENPGQTYWSQYRENVQNTIDLADFLAARYRNDPAFLGIGLMNEPTGTTDSGILHNFYEEAYNKIRATGNDCVLIHSPLLHEQDPAHDQSFFAGKKNTWHEWHKYLIWGYEELTEDQILNSAVGGISNQISQWRGNWLFIGEWSIATAPKAPFKDKTKLIQLAKRMIAAVDKARQGWTYWTWKVSNDEDGLNGWSLRSLLRNGALPFNRV